MKQIIDQPQKSDMGSGWGHFELPEGIALGEVLEWLHKHQKSWGTVTIYRAGNVVRRFDYDLYNNKVFYHHLSGWEYKFPVKEVKFDYCFMSENIDIYVN